MDWPCGVLSCLRQAVTGSSQAQPPELERERTGLLCGDHEPDLTDPGGIERGGASD